MLNKVGTSRFTQLDKESSEKIQAKTVRHIAAPQENNLLVSHIYDKSPPSPNYLVNYYLVNSTIIPID